MIDYLSFVCNSIIYYYRIIRLEFNHQRLHYYTEIDAVLMIGRKLQFNNMQYLINYYERQQQQQQQLQCQQLQQNYLQPDRIQSPKKGGQIYDIKLYLT